MEINLDNFEARTNKCTIILELSQIPQAESCLQENLTEKPDDLTNLTNLGMLYFLQENYESAKTQLSIVHDRDPENETVYANLLAVSTLTEENIEKNY